MVPEIDVAGDRPRVGVFVCNCGINIGGIVRVPEVVEYARTLPGVVYVEENLFTCSQDTQDKMTAVIREKDLNRVVVAACTPRTHEALFQETLINAGLNKYLIEMANIRNQDSWVHAHDPDAATEKAKRLVRSAVARVAFHSALEPRVEPVKKAALVVGGGIAGMTAALAVAEGMERGPAGNTSLAAAFAIARQMDRDRIVVVQETEYTGAGKHPLGQLNLAKQMGIDVRRGDPRENQPGKAIVIPEHPSQIKPVEMNLDRIRRSYLRNALNSLAEGEKITATDIAFLVAESKSDETYVREAIESHERKKR